MGLMESLENAVGEVVNTVENKGAQVRGTDIKDVLTRLKTCIDDYLS